jgi:vacuolar protein sorting-associated protein 13A/C
MGTDLDSCMAALASDEISPDVHILERINMSFLVQTAILDAPNLTKFKIQGELPILQVNFSDRKYSESITSSSAGCLGGSTPLNALLFSETLMRFIDVAVPHFGDEDESGPALVRPTLPPTTSDSRHFSRGAGGFLQRPNIEEYNLDERESVVDDNVEADVHENDKFYEAPEITSDVG